MMLVFLSDFLMRRKFNQLWTFISVFHDRCIKSYIICPQRNAILNYIALNRLSTFNRHTLLILNIMLILLLRLIKGLFHQGYLLISVSFIYPHLILSFGVSSTAMALNINCIPNTLLTACSIFLLETAFQVQHIQSRTHHHNLMDFYVFRCQCLQEVLLLSPPT